MKSFSESPSIHNPDRRFVFPLIKWLTKEKFEEYLQLQEQNPARYQIYPYKDISESETTLQNRIFIGKTIFDQTNEVVELVYDYRSNREINLEVIGTVCKDIKGEWQLCVTHGSGMIEIKKEFLVLCINDNDSFQWISTKLDIIPNYSLRGAVDQLTREYFYIGLNYLNEKNVKGVHLENSEWKEEENLPSAFGKVHVSHQCLYAPFNNFEMRYTSYYILVLKPSPAPLKILCRLLVRKLNNFSDDNVKLINKNKSGRLYLPISLINFLKFPPYLSRGEYLIKGEKLVREDGKFEMLIENNHNLVIKSINNDPDEQDTQIKRIISSNVNSIWLHRFQLVIYKNDFTVYVMKNFFDDSYNYKLRIENDSPKPNFFIEFEPNYF